MEDYSQALSGGVLIGAASWILLAGAGRVSGVSSITSGVLTTHRQSSPWRWAFLFGLVGGGAFFGWLLNAPHPETRSALLLIPAGLLVGFGTVLGSGCTSGHGVCGLGRRSRRSLVAVLVSWVRALLRCCLHPICRPPNGGFRSCSKACSSCFIDRARHMNQRGASV